MDRLFFSGRMQLTGGQVEINHSLRCRDVQIDLPVIWWPGKGKSPVAGTSELSQKGRIRIGSISSSLVSAAEIDLPVKLSASGMTVGDLSLPLKTGRIRFEKISIKHPFQPNFVINASSTVENVDLSKLGWPPLPGHLEGRLWGQLTPVTIDRGQVVAAGHLSASLFDGQAVISRIAVSQPFQFKRKIECNITAKDMDLEKLTTALSFGRVTGVLGADIDNLVISQGRPEQFRMKLYSIKKPGVKQSVSLAAINDLQIISRGQESGLNLPLGLDLMFHKFSYDRLGIRCELHNGGFIIRGDIIENGKEYLIKQKEILGIDMISLLGIKLVNKSSVKPIGFNEMVNRLERVARKEQAARKTN
ncbi:MAG: hypothetical protein HQK60_19025 [Deltaproteobacteria bacterium]|nr:hypothetical protein [Deltaproteobacteria bacterium]